MYRNYGVRYYNIRDLFRDLFCMPLRLWVEAWHRSSNGAAWSSRQGLSSHRGIKQHNGPCFFNGFLEIGELGWQIEDRWGSHYPIIDFAIFGPPAAHRLFCTDLIQFSSVYAGYTWTSSRPVGWAVFSAQRKFFWEGAEKGFIYSILRDWASMS